MFRKFGWIKVPFVCEHGVIGKASGPDDSLKRINVAQNPHEIDDFQPIGLGSRVANLQQELLMQWNPTSLDTPLRIFSYA